LGAKFALSPKVDLMANYLVRTSNLTNGVTMGVGATAATGGNGRNGKVMGLGADYYLSKRTALTARFESLDVDTNLGITAGGSVTTATAVGVRHAF
jgi:predicted porin